MSATCFDCNMEITTKVDGRELRIECCPICGAWVCTCPDEGESGHKPGCPFGDHQAAAPAEGAQ